MFVRLLLLFTVIPVVELWLLIRIGSVIGAGPTILLVLATGVVGASLARREGFSVLQTIQARTARGEFPADAMIDGLCILLAGMVLITPGVITDVLGFLLLIPPTRTLLKGVIARFIRRAAAQGSIHVAGTFNRESFHGSESSNRDPFNEARRVRPADNPEAKFVDPDSPDIGNDPGDNDDRGAR